MLWNNIRDPLVVIVGPTAVGKTIISIDVAERINAEIISADSQLFYRGMDIGTAKPTLQEQTHVPHHLIGISDPDEDWSLGKFKSIVMQEIVEIHGRNRLPIMVGGTGQYVRAVIEGWEIPPIAANPVLREVLNDWSKSIGAEALHLRLQHIDPAAAAFIDRHNTRRTVRALEVIFSTGKLFSQQRVKKHCSFSFVLIGLKRPRDELYQRIDERIEAMIHNGFLAEVETLQDNGYTADLPSMSAIGYKEMFDVLHNVISQQEAITLMKKRTRTLVRRQANWFKESDPDIHWFSADENCAQRICDFILKKEGWKFPQYDI